jgi:hypothetical protein
MNASNHNVSNQKMLVLLKLANETATLWNAAKAHLACDGAIPDDLRDMVDDHMMSLTRALDEQAIDFPF